MKINYIVLGAIIILIIGVIIMFNYNSQSSELKKYGYENAIILKATELINTDLIVSNISYVEDLRSSDSVTIIELSDSSIIKEYNSTDKNVKLTDENNNLIISLSLLSNYTIKVGTGNDVMIANFSLKDYSKIESIIDSIKFYDVNNGYKRIEKDFNLKYLVETPEEVCYPYIEKKKEIKNCTTIYNKDWINFTSLDELPRKEIIIGLFTSTKKDEHIEWIPTINNIEIVEWGAYVTKYTLDTTIDAVRGIECLGSYCYISDYTDDEIYIYWANNFTYTGQHWDTSVKVRDTYELTVYDNYLWIIDYYNDDVTKYYLNGTYINEFATGNTEPKGITTDGNYIFVCDNGVDRIKRFYMNGTYKDYTATSTLNDNCQGVGTDGTYLWLSDYTDDAIYQYYINGTYSGVYWSTGANGSDAPMGIAYRHDGSNGYVYNTDPAREVYKWDDGIAEEPPEDSCTYVDGDWEVLCSDNCLIDSELDVGGNDIIITGTGTFTINGANVTNYGNLYIKGTDDSNKCNVYCLGGCFV